MQTHGFDVLLGVASARLRPEERWLDESLAAARQRNVNSLLAAYTAASRKAAGRPLTLTAIEHASIDALSSGLSCERWMLEDLIRATLLLEAARIESDAQGWIDIASACYENGDAREQQSWLKAISLLPLAERFVASGIDACRSHIQPTFEAIACDNPYPSVHFPDLNFNQLVLKALFIGVPLARIVGLRRRLNPDLSRMARDYAAERRAAGRSVPADLSFALHDARIEEPVS
ncbi:MAG TPA: EboA domain-containing protein [Vicinamibacterales bacterium]|nr:EboA domain-containing protein [Vicinamibacterales bacterium]